MILNPLSAVSPIDGRYHSKTKELGKYFSEYALMKYRVKVEIEYFIALLRLPLPQMKNVSMTAVENLRRIYNDFSEQDAQRIKEIENVTNHDVKAIEYFIKEKINHIAELKNIKEFIHFGLTSQDINNTSFPMMLKDGLQKTYQPLLEALIADLENKASEWANIPMLAKTHGQPASPTRLGKEIAVFSYRLKKQAEDLSISIDKIAGKFGGATGNFNAHHIAYPQINWVDFANQFLTKDLNIEREQYTTQISNYDNLSRVFDALKRINTIIIDLDRDIWQYISMGYFKQKIKEGEVGSSAMPHKVNPIDFENSEGNLGIANASLEFLSRKLPISRLQRDLTDSTVIRNIGVPIAHGVISLTSTIKGLGKLVLNEEAINKDLDDCWPVVAEALQTILRREAYPNPYEALKKLTRTNKKITQKEIGEFIAELDVSEDIKKELRNITPHNYTGV